MATRKTFIILALSVITAISAEIVSAQPPVPRPPSSVLVRVAPFPAGETTERSIAVDPNVNIKFCVSDGQLTINGWNRNEVRAFVRNGAKFEVRVLESSSAGPNWIVIERDRGAKMNVSGVSSECLSGESIELDVPKTASLEVRGRSTESVVDSVRKVNIRNVEGNITLRNIEGGLVAATYQGDLTVERSSGAISLESATGNVLAFEVSPGDVGDVFRAKTNSGTISLQNTQHRQIEATSITGSLFFDGSFRTGGIYTFRTSNGAMRLSIPKDSACQIASSYGFGSFNSEIPVETLTENITEGGRNFVAQMGDAGSCTLNLTTTSGSITITAADPEPEK